MTISYQTLASGETFQSFAIAAGHNNIAGLTNLELIEVDGIRFQPRMGFDQWDDGEQVIRGDYLEPMQGSASVRWENAISRSQYVYLYEQILGFEYSGNVTISTPRFEPGTYINCNAVLSLRKPNQYQSSGGWFLDFAFEFTNVVPISEYSSAYGQSY